MKMVALIPARAGSKRVPGKNTRLLGGKPLIAWTIEAAEQSGVFAHILVSSDDDAVLKTAMTFGGSMFVSRPEILARDESPDIEWVRDALEFAPLMYVPDAFAILRPTSPFRTAATIQRAYRRFDYVGCDSIRAVERVTEHPGKMWRVDGATDTMSPLIVGANEYADGSIVPWHSCPSQSLPIIYRQNASLEMAYTCVVKETGTISGNSIAPFFTEGDEGFDINTEADWTRAEQIVASRQVSA